MSIPVLIRSKTPRSRAAADRGARERQGTRRSRRASSRSGGVRRASRSSRSRCRCCARGRRRCAGPAAVAADRPLAVACGDGFDIGTGYTCPSLALVPMLFLALRRSCRARAAGLMLGASCRTRIRARGCGARPVLAASANSWLSVGPALVFSGAAPRRRAARRGLAGLPCSLAGAVRPRLRRSYAFAEGTSARRPAARDSSASLGSTASTPRWPRRLLASPGADEDASRSGAAQLPLLGLLWLFARERRRRSIRRSSSTAPTAAPRSLLGDVVELDDEYTGSHSRDVVESRSRWASGCGSTPPQRATSSSPRCCTTSARSPSRRRSSTSPARSTHEEWEIMQDAHDRGPADARPRRRRHARRRPDRALVPRAVGRRRLPRRPGRRRDPARGAHHAPSATPSTR